MADTKNYGLKGVGDDVQYGKSGGRFVFNTGASDFRATTDGSTLAHLQVLTPVGDTDAATKLYVDSTATGLDFKESCVCATTATTGTYNNVGGPSANGQLTAVAATIDGVTLAEGDRVLIKDHSTAAANGIYIVTSTTTTLNRATDSDSDAEVTAGNFTFIEEGTANADAGFVLQGPDPLTVGTAGGSDMNWVLFSTSSDLIAGDAITKTGNTLNLDFIGGGGLTNSVAIAVGDEIAFADTGSGNAMQLRSMTNVLADLDIVTAAANGMLVRTSADNYASRTLTPSAVAGDEGISIVNGNGVSGNPTIGIDILGQTNIVTDDIDDADEMLIYHSVAAGTEGVGNYAITASKLKTYMNAGTSATSITEGDTTLAVSDTGTDGTLTFTADNVVQFTVDDTTFTTADNLNFSLAGTSSLTIAGLTDNDVLIAGTAGLVEDSGGALTFDGSVLAVTGTQTITTDSATTNADIPVITLRATSTGTPAAGIGPSIEFESETTAGGPGNVEIGGVLALEATDVGAATEDFDFVFDTMAGGATAVERMRISSLGVVTASVFSGDLTIDGTAFVTVDTAGQFTDDDVTLMTAAAVNDRIESFGYSTTTGTVTSSGTPLNNEVAVFATATDINSDSTFTWDATTLIVNELSFAGDTISNNTTDQPLILRPNGTGSLILQNGSGEEILELLDTASALNHISITAGATGNSPVISANVTGSETNVDIGFITKGTGALTVDDGAGTYETRVTADDDIPNKKYVDDAIQTVGGSGSLDSVTGTVDLTTASVQNIGAATGIPASCTILSVLLDVTTLSDAVTTVTVGDVTNGAASYMAATENDPEAADIYIADGRLANGGAARQATATVATAGTVGAATCIITFRHA